MSNIPRPPWMDERKATPYTANGERLMTIKHMEGYVLEQQGRAVYHYNSPGLRYDLVPEEPLLPWKVRKWWAQIVAPFLFWGLVYFVGFLILGNKEVSLPMALSCAGLWMMIIWMLGFRSG